MRRLAWIGVFLIGGSLSALAAVGTGYTFFGDATYVSRPWKNAFAEDGGPNCAVRLAAGLRADPGTQAWIACSSGPTPMIAITRFML